MHTLVRDAPSAAISAMASNSPGNAITASMIRISTLSTILPEKPETAPRKIPAASARVTEPRPAMTEMRAP